MTRAYAAEADLLPNDLALTGVKALTDRLSTEYPDLAWKPRLRFSGLLDIPDESGETRAQGPISGLAVELLGQTGSEVEILNLEKGLVAGHLPQRHGEILVPSGLAESLKIKPGDRVTIISSTMTGALAIADFTAAGIIRYGITPLDRGLVIADLADIQGFLDMEDAVGEIFGFLPGLLYDARAAARIAREFNQKTGTESGPEPDFQPVMLTLGEQGGLEDMISIYDTYAYVLVAVFVAVMSIVLWNAGLMGSLRRYGEIGLRLAMGETRPHLYFSLLGESLIVGVLGSLLGTALGLAIAYYLQTYGINAEAFTKSSEMMMTNIIRARVTWVSYVIGFIPGLMATLLGTAIAGLGVFRRRTATLMKEFEA